MDRADLERWISDYERAWRTPGTEALEQLFTPDATYRTTPFAEPIRGLDAIAALWEAEREGPDEPFTMTSETVAVEGDVGVARVDVRYGRPGGTHYLDLWIVSLEPGGRCAAFEEWPFWPERERTPDG